ncbi:MAG: hypothetical protein CL881_08915 [Dehalococcoidia bacterium]|jgi:hypothetical protein|nr:hypothetical protein [Dehalococcoidia bacterium]|tara:strand:- start:16671 stop:16880 length:210 start_codon:yes stop_codon:yes gene_type:complete
MIKDVINAKTAKEATIEILIFMLVILVSTFLLRFTWNNSLSKHITVLKPIKTFFDALLLSISIQIVRGI